MCHGHHNLCTSIASTGGADSSFFLDFACALAVTDNIAVLTWRLLHVNIFTVLILTPTYLGLFFLFFFPRWSGISIE